MSLALAAKLQAMLEGEVRADTFTRQVYSVDASICKLEPQLVVLPRSRTDIEAALALARDEGLSVTARGAATGTTGGCLGNGIVIDCSRHLRTILAIEPEARTARCQPGVVQDVLNAAAARHGLRYGPDTSTGNRATLGGMLGNNSSGAHSMRYGKTVDNLVATENVLSTGEVLTFADWSPDALAAKATGDGRQAAICREVVAVRDTLAASIDQRFPKLQRRVAGYNFDELIKPGPVNLSRLICGAEGTLAVTTELTVTHWPMPAATGLCVIHTENLTELLAEVPWILTAAPYSLEAVDRHIVRMGRRSPVLRGRLGWLEGDPDGLLAVEFDGESEAEVRARLETFAADARRRGLGYAHPVMLDRQTIDSVWTLRKSAIGLLMARRTNEKAIAFLEDVAVPPEQLGRFLTAFNRIMGDRGKEVGLCAHAGVGQMHVRPMMDLHRQQDVDTMLALLTEISDLAAAHGGTISGEHGDGLIRSWLVERAFGPELYGAFKRVKAAFDPLRLMNPGKIVDAPRPDTCLKVGPATRYATFETQFDWSRDGGFPFAVEMCNGNGECRKLKNGPMCPSYQATLDEYDTTRARAVALQAVVRGEAGLPGLDNPELKRILDLCLQCKGCQHECPSQVDMAKMKAEVLYHYQQTHGVPLRSRVFASIDRINRVGTAVAPLANWLMGTRLSRFGMARLGLTPQRQLPPFANQRFSRWFARRPARTAPSPRGQVALFVDTYVEFNYPEIGRDAVAVLEAAGYEVVLTEYACCGRPAISKGLLPKAKRMARKLVATLAPLAEAGIPIVGLEPSCILTIKDEYRSLVPGETTERVAAACRTIDEFLATAAERGELEGLFRSRPAPTWVHGHCYQKADTGTSATLRVLRAIPGNDVHEIDSGCCGMAGSFGYESEHYDFSLRVGETRLFPAIRQLPATAAIVADGISCRAQIEHGTQRPARHLVQQLAAALTHPAVPTNAPGE